MHEMSIVLQLIDLATEHAARAGAQKILELELDIGTHSGIEIEAFQAAMEVAKKRTPLENAQLKINRILARAECGECGQLFEVEEPLTGCPVCGNLSVRISSGMELQLKSLLVE